MAKTEPKQDAPAPHSEESKQAALLAVILALSPLTRAAAVDVLRAAAAFHGVQITTEFPR